MVFDLALSRRLLVLCRVLRDLTIQTHSATAVIRNVAVKTFLKRHAQQPLFAYKIKT